MAPKWLSVAFATTAAHALLSTIPQAAVDRALVHHLGARSSTGFDLRSALHSVTVTVLAAAALLAEAQNELREPERSYACAGPASVLSWVVPPIELGYGLHDLASALRRRHADFALHGALVTAMLLALCHLGVAHHTSRVSITHASTVLLNARRVDLGPEVNRRVDTAFALSFLVLRCVLLPYWWVLFIAHGYATSASEWGPCMHGGAVVLVALVGGALMHGLNLFWASLIFVKVWQRARGGMRRPGGIGSNGFRKAPTPQ